MRRYNRRKAKDWEELEARLDAIGGRPASARRRKKRRSGRPLAGLLLLAGVLAVIYAIFAAATGGDEARAEPVKIRVAKGDTLSGVAERLEEKGVIGSSFLFELEARLEGKSTAIKPGEYTFRPGEDDDRILARLTAGQAAPTFTVTIPEGLTIEQTAQRVARASGGDITVEEFERAARSTDYPYAFLKDPAIETTEGFLFPKKYEFEKGTTARQVVDRLLEQYLIETQGLDIEGARERLNLTEYELVITASLIEREAANPQEKPLIASVIYNRLREGMPLQIDATIQYARGEPKENLSLQDLKINSPYNTYQNTGLPPGPICSPSLSSLQAAVNPAETDYLYYVLKRGGEEHFFTSDYQEFLRAKEAAGL